MLNNTSSDFELTIRQQPNRARVAGGKEKGMSCLHPSSSPPTNVFLLLSLLLSTRSFVWKWKWRGIVGLLTLVAL